MTQEKLRILDLSPYICLTVEFYEEGGTSKFHNSILSYEVQMLIFRTMHKHELRAKLYK